MSAINLCLWGAGLGLQLTLVAVLFLRRVARRFPIFTLLVIFYVLRSVTLFALFDYLARSTYSQLYDFLSLADLCLQILLAGEIAFSILRQSSGWTWSRMAKVALFAALALGVAGGVAALLPTPGSVPVDRGAAFAAVLMVLLLLWAVLARVAGATRRIAEGFAVYGIVSVLAGIARSYAALHRNAGAYAASSYAQAGIYMAVVVYWLFTLKTEPAVE
jgi:hypothetical protein